MQHPTPITVAFGDGIGPEIMEAVLKILQKASAAITVETIDVGKAYYEKGYTSGIPGDAWASIERTSVLLKGPITTPQGSGYKSLNVTLRKRLGLYANVRPCSSFYPFVATKHPSLDIVVIRENEEDLYAGIEYRSTRNYYQAVKLASYTGCIRIMRYAFEYAIRHNRKKVTCMSKDNILKMTDGLFHRAFKEVAQAYPTVQANHYILDIGTAKLADAPEQFDVVVTSNLYGDVISDVVAEISGSVGLAGSANIGEHFALFEAIHGSAPDIAGKDVANPSGLLHAAIMMLVHIGQPEVASMVHNAWLATIEAGLHTADIYTSEKSRQKLGTQAFAEAVIEQLGAKPTHYHPVQYQPREGASAALQPSHTLCLPTAETKQLVGVDVYIDWHLSSDCNQLVHLITPLLDNELQIQMVSAKGLTVWPNELPARHVPLNDYWQIRFVPNNPEKLTTHASILHLLHQLVQAGLDVAQTQHLYCYDGHIGFSLGQGE